MRFSFVMRFTVMASIVALAALATAVPQSAGKRGPGAAIPITKRSNLVNADKSVNLDGLNVHVTSVKAKIRRGLANYEKNTRSRHPSATEWVEKRDALGPANELSCKGNVWYGNIVVGSPLQGFTVVFDTASSDLFLPSQQCDDTCKGHSTWDATSSSTSHDLHHTILLEYPFDGSSVLTEVYTDNVSIIGFDGVATNQTIGVGLSYSPKFQDSPADGWAGMAFAQLSQYGSTSIFDTFVGEKQVNDAVFSFKFSSSGGELYLGGVNNKLYTGEFAYANVSTPAYWQVNMDNVQANGQTIFSNINSIIDTSTNAIIGNPSQVSELHSVLGGMHAQNGRDPQGYYTFACDSFPSNNISFSFGGVSFPISASSLNLGPVMEGSSDCLSGILGMDIGVDSWVIGNVFLQNVYTKFDFGSKTVGFAHLA